jgi:hypothetical protein
MKTTLRLLVIAAALLALVGCVQTDIVINLNQDGSGTVTETVMMAKAVTQQMRATMEQMQQQGSGGEDTGPVELWKEEEIRAQAQGMGEGVKFEKMEKIENDEFEGYKAVYSFTDINKLLVNQNPGGNVPKQEGQAEDDAEQKADEFIVFNMQKGSPSTLTIRQPAVSNAIESKNTEAQAEKPEQPEMDAAQKEIMMSMMKTMLEGMKISISVEVPGKVVSSNATYRKGSRITLMEMDFDKLIASEEDWKKFTEEQPDTVEQTKEIMKNIPGMKVETEKEITVQFK